MADSNKKVGYIYKIYDNTNANVYYGSTTQPLSKRMAFHRNSYKRNLKGMAAYDRSAFKILENNNYSYNVVEKVEFEDKFELYTRERFYIENNECVNKQIPTRTTKEWCDDNKEEIKVKGKQYYEDNKEEIKVKSKQYYEDNKEEIAVKKKQYREDNKEEITVKNKQYYEDNKEWVAVKNKQYRDDNKEEIAVQRKQYREDNKEEILVRNKQYREDNKDKIAIKKKEKITCECGCIVVKNSMTCHRKTEKHKRLLASATTQ